MFGVLKKTPRLPIGRNEFRAIALLSRCRFRRDGWDEGFVGSMADLKARGVTWLSPRQIEHIWRLVRLYRTQIGDAEIVKIAEAFGAKQCAKAHEEEIAGEATVARR